MDADKLQKVVRKVSKIILTECGSHAESRFVIASVNDFFTITMVEDYLKELNSKK